MGTKSCKHVGYFTTRLVLQHSCMYNQQISHIDLHRLFKLQKYICLKLKIDENAFSDIHVGCGPEIDNTVKSPGYPNSYPPNTDCFSWIPIPQGMAMVMFFNDFELEYSKSCG